MTAVNKQIDQATEQYSIQPVGQMEDASGALEQATYQLYEGDRRFHRRLPLRGCRLDVRPHDSMLNHWIEAKPLDLSCGGLLFQSRHPFKKGCKLWIRITPDHTDALFTPFEIGAEIRHVKYQNGQYRVGVEVRWDMIQDMRRLHSQQALAQLENLLAIVDELSTERKASA